jgi:hypothetical protein
MATIMSTERQEAYDDLEQLVFRWSLRRDIAMDAAERIGPAAVLRVIQAIVTKNQKRKAEDLPPIGVKAAFKQNIRIALSESKGHEADIEMRHHQELVQEQYDAGYRPFKTTIWAGLDKMQESGEAEENGFSAHDVERGKAFLERLEYMTE